MLQRIEDEYYKMEFSYIDEDSLQLTKKQKEGYMKMINGRNVFLTGFAGTGKTRLIKLFYEKYKKSKKIGLTSTTGTSALLIGGSTLHSFTGIKLGKGDADTLAMNIMMTSYLKKRWQSLDVLIIDEISMLSPDLFDKLEYIARTVRATDAPFGGIQLILTGDFLQLPCVDSDLFCFQAQTWNRCVTDIVYLTEIVRQDDKKFRSALSKIRLGEVDDDVKKILESRVGVELENDLGIKPTVLYPLKRNVEQINNEELDKLGDVEFYSYRMKFIINHDVKNKQSVIDKFRKSMIAQEELDLAIGAQVMLLCNLDLKAGLANGSRGVVTGFENDMPIVLFLNGVTKVIGYYDWIVEEGFNPIMKARQIPLNIAYALTIHKVQGATLDYATIDLMNIFEYGQAYVALSRVTDLNGLSILGINWSAIQAHPEAVKYYKSIV